MQNNEKDGGDGVKLPVSLRDWFAGQILPAVFAAFNPKTGVDARELGHMICATAYEFADGMLKARERHNAEAIPADG